MRDLLRVPCTRTPARAYLRSAHGNREHYRAMLKALGTPEEGGTLVGSWHFIDFIF